MKVFKKILAGTVSAAVLVSALSVPTAAMTAATQTKTKSGKFTVGNKTYSYGGDLRASYTQATASVSSGRNMNLLVRVTANTIRGDLVFKNEATEAILDTSASVSVGNTFDNNGTKFTANISEAIGIYGIGTIDHFDLKIE